MIKVLDRYYNDGLMREVAPSYSADGKVVGAQIVWETGVQVLALGEHGKVLLKQLDDTFGVVGIEVQLDGDKYTVFAKYFDKYLKNEEDKCAFCEGKPTPTDVEEWAVYERWLKKHPGEKCPICKGKG